MDNQLKFYTRGEEIANAVTHGIGTLLSIAALVLLIVFSTRMGDKWYIVSYTIYGVSMFILYLESTLYHSITNLKAKKVFRIFDHASIYLLIAGTYTPFKEFHRMDDIWHSMDYGYLWNSNENILDRQT